MFAIRPILLAIAATAASPFTPSQALAATELAQPAARAVAAGVTKTVSPGAAGSKASAAKVVANEPRVPKMSAAQIVEKHVAARGGAQAWKTVQTMQLSGKIEAGRGDNVARARKLSSASAKAGGKGTNAAVVAANADVDSAKQILLPFTLDLKRPNRMRLEVEFDGKTAVQVFDGKQGWKYRPFLNRNDVEPFTVDEANAEAARADLDGLLIDHAAKGTKVDVEGADLVDEQPAYRLKVTLKSGAVKHVWIDAKTFLDVKIEGFPKRMDGKVHPVYVYQRDFRPVQGVMIPFVLETAVEGYGDTHKLLIDKAAVNPSFDNAVFSKPRA
jgi:outer membrane lipoprotein-sorting protein